MSGPSSPPRTQAAPRELRAPWPRDRLPPRGPGAWSGAHWPQCVCTCALTPAHTLTLMLPESQPRLSGRSAEPTLGDPHARPQGHNAKPHTLLCDPLPSSWRGRGAARSPPTTCQARPGPIRVRQPPGARFLSGQGQRPEHRQWKIADCASRRTTDSTAFIQREGSPAIRCGWQSQRTWPPARAVLVGLESPRSPLCALRRWVKLPKDGAQLPSMKPSFSLATPLKNQAAATLTESMSPHVPPAPVGLGSPPLC